MIEVEGVIIDEKPYGETSKILNIITKLNGYGATLILITPIKRKD